MNITRTQEWLQQCVVLHKTCNLPLDIPGQRKTPKRLLSISQHENQALYKSGWHQWTSRSSQQLCVTSPSAIAGAPTTFLLLKKGYCEAFLNDVPIHHPTFNNFPDLSRPRLLLHLDRLTVHLARFTTRLG